MKEKLLMKKLQVKACRKTCKRDLSVGLAGATRPVIEVVSLDGVSRFNRSLSQSWETWEEEHRAYQADPRATGFRFL